MTRSRSDDNEPETAPEPTPTPPPAGTTTAGLSLEERIARLEKKLVPIIGEL